MKPSFSVLDNIIPKEEFSEDQRAEMRKNLKLKNDREFDEWKLSRWLQICPPEYEKPLDYSKLRPGNHKTIREMIEWKEFPKGFYLIGPTGKGKTRTAWAALRHRWFAGRSVRFKSGFRVAQDAVISMKDVDDAARIMQQYLEPDILLLDDVGKRLPPSALQFPFEVIEKRTINGKTIVGTSNLTMDALAESIGDLTTADPIIRRIQEFCDVRALV